MVKIYTVSFSRPDFIFLQWKQFKRYLQDEFEFIVLNNAINYNERESIKNICNDLKIQCIDIDNRGYKKNSAALPALDYCINNFISKESKGNVSVIIDSDVFLFKPYSFKNIVENSDISSIYQQREKISFRFFKRNLEYCWIAFLVFNHNRLSYKELSLDYIPGVTDLGGASHFYIKKFKPKINWIPHTSDIGDEGSLIFNEKVIGPYKKEFGFQIIDTAFIHYYRGSNWDNKDLDYHKMKTNFLEAFLENSCSSINVEQLLSFSSPIQHSKIHYNGSSEKMPRTVEANIMKAISNQ